MSCEHIGIAEDVAKLTPEDQIEVIFEAKLIRDSAYGKYLNLIKIANNSSDCDDMKEAVDFGEKYGFTLKEKE